MVTIDKNKLILHYDYELDKEQVFTLVNQLIHLMRHEPQGNEVGTHELLTLLGVFADIYGFMPILYEQDMRQFEKHKLERLSEESEARKASIMHEELEILRKRNIELENRLSEYETDRPNT